MLELEATFLVKNLPSDLNLNRFDHIKQGYFSHGRTPLRIRQKGNKFELTKKEIVFPGDFSHFRETTISVTYEEFKKLWKEVVKSLEKKRYYYNLSDNLVAEIDVFEGNLKGLILVEVEFPSKKVRAAFKKPPWFGNDVTQERWVAGESLAGKCFEEIKDFLKRPSSL